MTDSGVVKQFKDGEIPLSSKALLLLLILFLVPLLFKDISHNIFLQFTIIRTLSFLNFTTIQNSGFPPTKSSSIRTKMFLLHDLLVKAGQVNFFHIAHVEHVSAKEKKVQYKKKRLFKAILTTILNTVMMS